MPRKGTRLSVLGRLGFRRPSPAMLIAVIALSVAVGGSATAAVVSGGGPGDNGAASAAKKKAKKKKKSKSKRTARLVGPQGQVGDQGPQGAAGPQGPAGADGLPGLQGDQGPQGDQGVQGDQGPQGDQGVQGERGLRGAKGDQGDQGEQGEQGDRGPAGPEVVRYAADIAADGTVNHAYSNGPEPTVEAQGPPSVYTITFPDGPGHVMATYAAVVSLHAPTPSAAFVYASANRNVITVRTGSLQNPAGGGPAAFDIDVISLPPIAPPQ